MQPIYLDHNATTDPSPAVVEAMIPWLGRAANASSVHAPGRAARGAVETARRAVAASLGGAPAEVIFTGGATEALHLAIAGTVRPGQRVVISAVEHPAVAGACAVAGAEIVRVPVDAEGAISPTAYVQACEGAALAVLMAAQNEIGRLYPVQAVAEAIAPCPLLCDAAQLWGRASIDVSALGATMVAVSGHKIGGPQGVGALWVRRGHALRPHLAGGAQERGRRAGTENVAGLAGLGVAAERLPGRIDAMADIRRLRDQLAVSLAERIEGWIPHGRPEAGLPNTLAGRITGVDGDILLAALDLEGIYISSGSACSSGSVEPSSVLLAMGLSPEEARGGLRISLGPRTSAEEIARVIEVLPRVVERVRAARDETY